MGKEGLPNADATVSFCPGKRQKYADTGKGSKNGQILRTSFMDGPLINNQAC